jgi:hypothetical protein
MSEILFEYVRQGSSVKVTAIETDTGIEAVVVVPANLPEDQMQMKALQKLRYIMQKKVDE